jgi:hypothetical protein
VQRQAGGVRRASGEALGDGGDEALVVLLGEVTEEEGVGAGVSGHVRKGDFLKAGDNGVAGAGGIDADGGLAVDRCQRGGRGLGQAGRGEQRGCRGAGGQSVEPEVQGGFVVWQAPTRIQRAFGGRGGEEALEDARKASWARGVGADLRSGGCMQWADQGEIAGWQAQDFAFEATGEIGEDGSGNAGVMGAQIFDGGEMQGEDGAPGATAGRAAGGFAQGGDGRVGWRDAWHGHRHGHASLWRRDLNAELGWLLGLAFRGEVLANIASRSPERYAMPWI